MYSTPHISCNQYLHTSIILKCCFNCICAYFIKNKINVLRNQCSLQSSLQMDGESEWLTNMQKELMPFVHNVNTGAYNEKSIIT